MFLEFRSPLPVIVKDKNDQDQERYAIYVRDGDQFENDCFCVVLADGGKVQHYLSSQIRVRFNATYGITK